ncbi:MAG: sulfite exporter TauE/SafE family protein [Nostoc indistinguendum CM1-VF10]|nr:sulfite exporter TauE/SafE family protein [Nostoc indistinguendum CM1-VF10]
MFAFGADIKTAGTASLLVSLPTVLVGVIKYASRGAFVDRTVLSNTIAPMGVGSVIGAIIGGMLVDLFPASLLKITLGVILNISAFRVFHKARHSRI